MVIPGGEYFAALVENLSERPLIRTESMRSRMSSSEALPRRRGSRTVAAALKRRIDKVAGSAHFGGALLQAVAADARSVENILDFDMSRSDS